MGMANRERNFAYWTASSSATDTSLAQLPDPHKLGDTPAAVAHGRCKLVAHACRRLVAHARCWRASSLNRLPRRLLVTWERASSACDPIECVRSAMQVSWASESGQQTGLQAGRALPRPPEHSKRRRKYPV